MKEWLERFIRGQEGFATARITSLQRMPGGASKETWAFDLQPGQEGGETLLPLVLRIERASPLPVLLDLETEFRLLQEFYREGVPIPRPSWAGKDALGSPFTVLERVHGETLVRRLQREARDLRRLLAAPEPAGEVSGDRLREEVVGLNRELCRQIRDGRADAGPRKREILDHLLKTVIAKLEIANPVFIRQATGERR